MIQQLQHKRFTTQMLNDVLSYVVCPWCVQERRSIMPAGNAYDSKHQRPECMST